MRFNPCNPCCTSLPAWMVRHTEISNGMHVVQVNFSVTVRATDDVDSQGFPITKNSSYNSFLFYESSYEDDDGNEFWVFKNCPNVEGQVYARMVVGLVDKIANGRCEEQIWIKPVYVKEFVYRDPDSTIENDDYSTFTFKFETGSFINTCCHLIGIKGENYLELNGNLTLDDEWEIKGYNKETAKSIPNAWFTMALAAKAGTVDYQLVQCDDLSIPYFRYANSPIGTYTFGDATPGHYWMVGYTPPAVGPDIPFTNYSYDEPDPNGMYMNRWSLSSFGVAGKSTPGSGSAGPTLCDPRVSQLIFATSSMQTNPVYLDSACGYAIYYNGQIYYNYWPWQYYWGGYYNYLQAEEIAGLGGGNLVNFGWGPWNYGYWWNYCDLGNPGIYYPWGYGWWWGGPYWAGGLGLGGIWGWWGGYPCGFVGSWWWWGYGYSGWWGYFDWWWWGASYPGYGMLGEWVNNSTQGNFDDWYSSLAPQDFEHTWCVGYGECQQLYINPVGLECSLYGTAPVSISMKVKYGGVKGNVKLSGNWENFVYSYTYGNANQTIPFYTGFNQASFKDCGGVMRATGTLTATGDITGSVDVTFSTTSCCNDIAIFYGPGNPKLTFFGTGTFKDPNNGNEYAVQLNGEYTIPASSYTGFGGNLLNGSLGEIQSGKVKITPRFKTGFTEIEINATGFDFSSIDQMFFASDLTGTLPLAYAPVIYKHDNCNNNIDCVPKKPLFGQANLQSHDVTYTYIFKKTSDLPSCYLIDIVADKQKYCYGIAFYEPPEGRHCLDELRPDFVRVTNPPLSSFEELPWDDDACSGEVDMVQEVALISDECIPEEENVPTPHGN